MRLHSRLQRLEQRLGTPDDGCPACRDRRGRIAFTTSQRMPDGTTVPEGDWPAPCAACGGTPEQILEIVKPLVGHEDAARLEDGWTGPARPGREGL